MPSVPGSAFQLIMLLLFVLPGSVYQFTRNRLRGPQRDDFSALNRTLRALGVSTLLVTVYALSLGRPVLALIQRAQSADTGEALGAVRPLALYALLLLFVVPVTAAATAAVLSAIARKVPRPGFLGKIRLSYDPTPTAWDFMFYGLGPTYLRVLTTEGTYVGGWYGSESFVTSYPEPHEMFLETAHVMEDDGSFGPEVENGSGVFIRCEDIRLVEVVGAAVDPQATEDAP